MITIVTFSVEFRSKVEWEWTHVCMYKVCRNSFGVFPGLHRLVTTACTNPEGEGRGPYINRADRE